MVRQSESEAVQLLESIRALVRRFSLAERADTECCGITVAQAATLDALRRHGGSMRPAELSRSLGISPSTLTRNMARLEERGLVEKAPDPTDRRANQVRLTDAGWSAAAQVRSQEEAFAASVLDRLPAGSAGPVLEALTSLLIAIRDATGDCCPGADDHLMADWPDRRSER